MTLEAQQRLRLLADNMQDLVCLHQLDGRFVYVSPSSKWVLGYAPEDLIGTLHSDLVHPDDLGCVRDELYDRLRMADTDLTVEYRARHRGGDYVWLETLARRLRELDGQVADEVITSSRDISRRKQAETAKKMAEEEVAQLHLLERAARTAADSANRAKDKFITMISHEFRTPLTTIKTLVRVMQHSPVNEDEWRGHLETIALECDRQIDMILNILDIARIEEGALDLRHERVDVAEVLGSCERIERYAAEARKQTFSVEQPRDVPPIRSDAKALRRALCSIIENAIKYTPDGGRIEISARVVDPAAANVPALGAAALPEVAIDVADTGRGIHPDDLPRVFNKFFRGRSLVPHDRTTDGTYDDAKGRAETPGVGLGLYLAHRIVSALNGRIEIASVPHKGSRFTTYQPVWSGHDGEDQTDEYGPFTMPR